jgi:hypothetical protein
MTDRHHQTFASALLASIMLAGCGQAPPAADKYVPSATIQELMDAFVDPAADVLWNAVSTTSDADGTREVQPTTPEEWLDLRRAAIVIVESANLLAVPGRRVASGSKTMDGEAIDVPAIQQRVTAQHDDMVRFAAALRDIGGKLIVVAEKQDVEALTDLGGVLDTVCEGCHRVFWYPESPLIP